MLTPDRPPLVQALLNYFKNGMWAIMSIAFSHAMSHFSAKTLVETVPYENVALIIRDLSWLWRTAYNCAIEGCSNWDNHGEEVANAFDIAREVSIWLPTFDPC